MSVHVKGSITVLLFLFIFSSNIANADETDILTAEETDSLTTDSVAETNPFVLPPLKRKEKIYFAVSGSPWLSNHVMGDPSTENKYLSIDASLSLKWGIQLGLGIDIDETIIGDLRKIAGLIGMKDIILTAQKISFISHIYYSGSATYQQPYHTKLYTDYYDICLLWRGMLGISYRNYNVPTRLLDLNLYKIMDIEGEIHKSSGFGKPGFTINIFSDYKIHALGIRFALDTFLRYMKDTEGYWGGLPNIVNHKNGIKFMGSFFLDTHFGMATIDDKSYALMLTLFPQTNVPKREFAIGAEASGILGVMYLQNLGKPERRWGKFGAGAGIHGYINVTFAQTSSLWWRYGVILKGSISF